MKTAHLGLIVLLAMPAVCATAGRASAQAAQAQDPLAAAARQAREKQKEQPKPAKVWDNDNIPSSGQVSVVGNAAQGAPGPGSAAKTEQQGQKSGASSAEKKSDLEAQLKSAKDDLKNLQTTLDFAQRKLALDQASYYQKPDYASDTAGAQKLKDEQSDIDAKQQQVDAAQKKVDDLEAQVQSSGTKDSGAGVDSSASGNSGDAPTSGKGSAQ